MKCSKKILAFVLCLSVAISLCPMMCFAADGEGSYSDNFDTLDLESTAFNKYPNTSLGQTSEVFMQDSKSQKGFKIVETEGVDGKTTKALEISNTTGDWLYLPFSDSFVHTKGMVTQLSYDVKFTKLPSDNDKFAGRSANFMVYGGSNGFVNDGNSDDLAAPAGAGDITLEKEVWYKIVSRIGADGKLTSYLLNAKTGAVLLEAPTTKVFTDGAAFKPNAIQFRANGTVFDDGTKVYITCQIDNAKVVQYNSATPPAISSAPIQDGATDVIRNKALTFQFNQGLSKDSVVKITSTDDPDATCKTSADVFGNLTVSFPNMLKRKATYTLSFEGVKNENGVACTEESITFTAEDLHIWNDVEISSVSAGTTTEISFTLSDVYGYPDFTGIVMAAAYEDGKMIGLDIVELNAASTETKLTKSFDIGSVSAGTEIQLMLLDNIYYPVPLASGKTIVQ